MSVLVHDADKNGNPILDRPRVVRIAEVVDGKQTWTTEEPTEKIKLSRLVSNAGEVIDALKTSRERARVVAARGARALQ